MKAYILYQRDFFYLPVTNAFLHCLGLLKYLSEFFLFFLLYIENLRYIDIVKQRIHSLYIS